MSVDEPDFLTRREYRDRHGIPADAQVAHLGEHTFGRPEALSLPGLASTAAHTRDPWDTAEGTFSHGPDFALPWEDAATSTAGATTPGAQGGFSVWDELESRAAAPEVDLVTAPETGQSAGARVRGVIARLLDRSRGTENTPVFLDSSAATAAASTEGDDSAWWTNEGAAASAEMTQAPADAPAYSEAALVEDNAKNTTTRAKTKAEARAAAKEAAKAAADEKHTAELAKKVDKANAKNRKKTDAMSEKKRLAIAAKEEKARIAAAKREALEEEKVERDDVRARAKRELKAQAEWRRKQKRRVAIKLNGGKEGFWQGTSKPKPLEITNAVRSLAIILEVSPGEVEAVKMMAEEFAGNRIGDSFDRIYDRLVKDNLTLVEAFEPEELFPPVVHNMLRVGAKTAKPGPALRTAVDLMDAGNDNRRKMVNAIREPLIVTVLSLGILFATAWVVVPSFLDLYEKLNLEVGIFTQIVIAFANISMWGIGIGALLAVVFSIWWFGHGRRSLRVRVGIDRWVLHAPLIGKGEQTGAAFQMFNILNSYLSVGSTEREALVNTASAMENRAIRRHLRATAQGLLRGQKTFADFLDDDMFPKLARSILATGQRTGQTTQAVRNLRDIYENESRIEGEQSVQKVVGVVSAISSLLFVLTATIVSIPPLEIFGATLSFRG